MSQTEINEIVSEFRKSTYDISEEEVKIVLELCRRKIELTGKTHEYMKLLLPDELKNHCLRRVINAVSFCRMGKECKGCAAYV